MCFLVVLLILWQRRGNAEDRAAAEANENNQCDLDPASCIEEPIRSRIANLTHLLFLEESHKDTLPYKCYREAPASVPHGTECMSCLLQEAGCLPGMNGGQFYEEVCRVYCSTERMPQKNTLEPSPSDGEKRRPESQDVKKSEENKGIFISVTPFFIFAIIIFLLLLIQVLFGFGICAGQLRLFICCDTFYKLISQHKLFALACIIIMIIVALALAYIYLF